MDFSWRLVNVLTLSCALMFTAAARELTSSSKQISLLELYTSEGCSSCPRADRWLSQLTEDERLWREVVPVAFHVDYWDYIGWADRFADPSYGERQRAYAHHENLKTVYTPGFMLAGNEWRSWFQTPVLSLEAPEVGPLAVELQGDDVHASFAPVTDPDEALDVHVTLLGFGLSTQIRAGENRGKTLNHDFVVLGHTRASMSRNGETYAAIAALPPTRVAAERIAIAAWVSATSNPRPLQAVGGWLDD